MPLIILSFCHSFTQHSFIHSFVYLFAHSSYSIPLRHLLTPSLMLSLAHALTHSDTEALICPLVHLCCILSLNNLRTQSIIHSHINLCMHPFTHFRIHAIAHSLNQTVYSIIHSFICAIICSYTHVFVHSFILSFVHSCFHPFILVLSTGGFSWTQACTLSVLSSSQCELLVWQSVYEECCMLM